MRVWGGCEVWGVWGTMGVWVCVGDGGVGIRVDEVVWGMRREGGGAGMLGLRVWTVEVTEGSNELRNMQLRELLLLL